MPADESKTQPETRRSTGPAVGSRDIVHAPRVVPRMQLARSLDDAKPGAFVHVDGRGRVRSPLRYRLIKLASYTTLATVFAGGAVYYTMMLGPAGAALIAVMAAFVARQMHTARRSDHAAVLLSSGMLAEAEAVLQPLTTRRFIGRRLRALVLQNLGAVAARRGEHATALAHLQSAIGLHASGRRPGAYLPYLRMCQYGEITLLCNLGRVTDARERLRALGPTPEGDYLLVLHWGAELYVAFAEGKLELDANELWERTHRALRMSAAAGLLALCSWGYHSRDDHDLAWHLLREAYDRIGSVPLSETMPSLWRWMEANRATAESAAPVD